MNFDLFKKQRSKTPEGKKQVAKNGGHYAGGAAIKLRAHSVEALLKQDTDFPCQKQARKKWSAPNSW